MRISRVALILLLSLPLKAAFLYYGGFDAASFAPHSLPNGSISRGSIFTLFGRELGPAQAAGVSAFPLQNTLAGTGR